MVNRTRHNGRRAPWDPEFKLGTDPANADFLRNFQIDEPELVDDELQVEDEPEVTDSEPGLDEVSELVVVASKPATEPLKTCQETQTPQDVAQPSTERSSEFSIGSVCDVARVARALFPSTLVLEKKALRKARKSRFVNLELIAQVLAVIAIARGDYAEVKVLLGPLGGKARLKPKDSRHTMSRYGKQRQFSGLDGERIEVQQHVTLGHGTKPHATIQIYFTQAEGRALIVYLGPHLHTVSGDT